MSASELQHYVPRFLLRKFGLGKKDRIHVFDKQKNCAFVSNAKAVAAENGFYDFEFMGTPMTLEPSLSKLESNASQHLAQIEDCYRLPKPLSEARVQLACFLAVQMVRTRARFNTLNDISHRMETWLRAQGINEGYFTPDPKSAMEITRKKPRWLGRSPMRRRILRRSCWKRTGCCCKPRACTPLLSGTARSRCTTQLIEVRAAIWDSMFAASSSTCRSIHS
jgi:hypothetical protein